MRPSAVGRFSMPASRVFSPLQSAAAQPMPAQEKSANLSDILDRFYDDLQKNKVLEASGTPVAFNKRSPYEELTAYVDFSGNALILAGVKNTRSADSYHLTAGDKNFGANGILGNVFDYWQALSEKERNAKILDDYKRDPQSFINGDYNYEMTQDFYDVEKPTEEQLRENANAYMFRCQADYDMADATVRRLKGTVQVLEKKL